MPSRPLNPATQPLLGLLQLKNGGRNPDALLDAVQPTIDMESFYLLASAVTTFRGIILPAFPTGFVAPDFDITSTVVGPLVVPDGQYWYVHEICAHLRPNTNDQFQVTNAAAAVALPIDFNYAHFVTGDLVTAIIPASVGSSPTPAVAFGTLRDIWLPPGTLLGAWMGEAWATLAGPLVPIELWMTARYTPVPI